MTTDQKNSIHTKLTQAGTAFLHSAPAIANALLQEACTLLLAVPTVPPARQMTPQELADFDKTGRLPQSE